jgi:hypothetical protein
MFLDLESFPVLENLDTYYQHYYREQICLFYFNLTRKSSPAEIQKLSIMLAELLSSMKSRININKNEYLPYLILLYKMIGETRDCFHGKGEHDLTYMMIYTWYKHYPIFAIYALHKLFFSFGSWRDMKYFCEYVRIHSPYGINDTLITTAVELMNRTLKQDNDLYHNVLHKYINISNFREHLSNVSKWIPRENKKFDWLHEKLVIHWFSTYHQNMLTSFIDYEGYYLALDKSKMLYRKMVALLSEKIDTTEMKLCSRNWASIKPKNIPQICMNQNQYRFLSCGVTDENFENKTHKVYSNELMQCSQHMKKHFDETFFMGGECRGEYDEHREHSTYIPHFGQFIHFVKTAYRILYSTSLSPATKELQIDLLNNQWSKMSQTIGNKSLYHYIPFIDMSFHMQSQTESFYSAIGLAILIAERSSWGKRIMVIDQRPSWVNLELCTNFYSMISTFDDLTKSSRYTSSNVLESFELLIHSFIQTQTSSYHIRNSNIVILTGNKWKKKTFDSVKELFSKNNLPCSRMILWNMSQNSIPILPGEFNHPNFFMMSGLSAGLIKHLYLLSNHTITNSFEFIREILNQGYYENLETYISNLS